MVESFIQLPSLFNTNRQPIVWRLKRMADGLKRGGIRQLKGYAQRKEKLRHLIKRESPSYLWKKALCRVKLI